MNNPSFLKHWLFSLELARHVLKYAYLFKFVPNRNSVSLPRFSQSVTFLIIYMHLQTIKKHRNWKSGMICLSKMLRHFYLFPDRYWIKYAIHILERSKLIVKLWVVRKIKRSRYTIQVVNPFSMLEKYKTIIYMLRRFPILI